MWRGEGERIAGRKRGLERRIEQLLEVLALFVREFGFWWLSVDPCATPVSSHARFPVIRRAIF
jgi:hypothetical protein